MYMNYGEDEESTSYMYDDKNSDEYNTEDEKKRKDVAFSSSEDEESPLEESYQNEPTKIKKPRYSQSYIKEWETQPDFQGWLKPSNKGKTFAYCDACHVDLSLAAGKRDLIKHIKRTKHKKLSKNIKNQQKIVDMQKFIKASSLEKQVSHAEIRMAAFIAEHNLAINVSSHMPQLLRAMFPESEVAAKINCSRTKTTGILKHVTGEQAHNYLIDILQNNKFSIIVDESTDVSCTKNLVVVVRVAHNLVVRDMFLDLIEVQKADAISIYSAIINVFKKFNIPYKSNLIGFGSDGANVMFGNKNSVAAFLKKDIPNIFLMKCICHSFHLVASYACQKIPRDIEELALDIYSYFNRSPKRSLELKEFQHFVEVKPHKLLYPSQTRWLSLEMVVKRLIEQFDALKLYFQDIVLNSDDDKEKATSIYNKLTLINKLYLHFLEFMLPFFNNLNKMMQSESTQIHKMHREISKVTRSILDLFIEQDKLNIIGNNLANFDHTDPRNFQKIEDMYFGARVEAFLLKQNNNISVQEINSFRITCLNFCIESVSQIKKRFDFSSVILQKLEYLDPLIVLDKHIRSIIPLCIQFPNLIAENMLQSIDTEWRLLRNETFDLEENINVDNFWKFISNIKTQDNNLAYPTLTKFIFQLMSLPHSSSNCERIFSSINLFKNKIRNKLQNDTIIGILRTKQLIDDKNCFDFKITDAMLQKMKASNLYK